MSIVFDHTKETLSECMGLKSTALEELSEKMSEIAKEFIVSKGAIKKSEVAEKIALELSYSDLIFIATGKVFEGIEHAVAKNNKIQDKLMEIISKLKDEDDDEE